MNQNSMDKCFKIVTWLILTILSFLILFRFIGDSWKFAIVILCLGLVSYVFELIIEKTFEGEMGFIGDILKLETDLNPKLFNITRSLSIILITQAIGQFINIDLLDVFLQGFSKSSAYELLLKATLIIIGVPFFLNLSYFILQENLGKSDRKFVNKKYNLTVTTSRTWNKDKTREENEILVLKNSIENTFLSICYHEKLEFEDNASIQDYSEFVFDCLKENKDINLTKRNIVDSGDVKKICYEILYIYKKRKYKSILLFFYDNSNFYMLEIGCIEKKFEHNKENFLEIVNSIELDCN